MGTVAEQDPETPWYLLPLKAIRDLIPERFPLLRLAVPTQLFSLAIALIVVQVTRVKPSPIRCNLPFLRALGLMVGLEIGLMALFLVLKLFVNEVKLPGYIERLLTALKKTTPLELVVTCASVGFVEEVAFRGVLLPLLGAVISSVLFGAAHRPRIAFHWFVLCTMGAVFAFELKISGGLLLPMVHHALHDLWALTLLYVVLRADPDGEVELK